MRGLAESWVRGSMKDLSSNKAAMGLSSVGKERDLSIASQGHILITPLSEPDHRSPGKMAIDVNSDRIHQNQTIDKKEKGS